MIDLIEFNLLKLSYKSQVSTLIPKCFIMSFQSRMSYQYTDNIFFVVS